MRERERERERETETETETERERLLLDKMCTFFNWSKVMVYK